MSKIYPNKLKTTSADDVFNPVPVSYEEKMTWYIRMFFAIILSVGFLASLVAGIIGFFLTRDPHFLAFISPAFLTPVITYLVPMDEKRFQIKLARIRANGKQAESLDKLERG